MSTAIARNNASDLLDDPVANRKAVFQLIYEEAGYSKRDAETLTIRALTRIRGYAVPVFTPQDKVEGDIILHEDAHPLALFQEYLIDARFDGDAAAAEAARLFAVLQPGFGGNEAEAGVPIGCVYYEGVVIFCEPDEFGGMRKKYAPIRIDSNCWESILALIPPQLPVCGANESRYFQVGVHCDGINDPCAAIREMNGPFEGSCDDVMGCECLSHGESIPTMCCPSKGGCMFCPCDWTWGH